jgi:hypothetical protein
VDFVYAFEGTTVRDRSECHGEYILSMYLLDRATKQFRLNPAELKLSGAVAGHYRDLLQTFSARLTRQ